jgi:formamidopyrimidine-DNA glycosylase
MPELPDVTVYVESLERRIVGQPLTEYAILNVFALRSVEPAPDVLVGRVVRGVRRLGKRIVIEFDDELRLVVHLMIAGRFRWIPTGSRARVPARIALAELTFPSGRLVLTEAGSKRRASIHVVQGTDALAPFERGGLEPLDATRDAFAERLARENHTLKRSLTDPHLFSGIGNAYSDEILHAARLSPFRMSQSLSVDESRRLFEAACATLREWIDRLRDQAAGEFPAKVTAFHDEMAVHGRYGQPCPRCGSPVQRIVYAANEANYCATCQTDGRLLADRALSRLLKKDWPRTLEELERRRSSLGS